MERAAVRHEVHVLDIKSMQGPQMLRVDDVHRGDEGIPWIVRGDENREMPIFFSLLPTRHVIVGIKAVESPDQSPFFLCREFEERSEEHTSELQSLMRISYAVFCLKQKK